MFCSINPKALGVLTLVVGLACSAGVAAKTQSQAAAAYEAGKGELRGGKFDAALKTFREGLGAVETDQLETWQLLLGAALASEKLDRGDEAIEYYRRFLDASEGAEKLLPPKWRERRQVVSDAVDELQRKLNLTHGYLTVSSTPAKAAIFVNGERAGVDGNATTPFGLFLQPGRYEIRLERGGYESVLKTIEIEVGKLKPLALQMEEVVVEAPMPVPAPTPKALKVGQGSEAPLVAARVSLGEPEESGLALPGWVLVATGGAVVVGGVVATVMGAMTHSDMANITAEGTPVTEAEWNDLSVNLELYNTMSAVMYGVGAAASVAGLVLVMLDTVGAQGEGTSETSFRVAPVPGGAYGHATLRF